jgi:hypothetical protein
LLNLTGLYRRRIDSCPLQYAGPNGSKISDVLDTEFLSVLSGRWRYVHIAALRADGVSVKPGIAGVRFEVVDSGIGVTP